MEIFAYLEQYGYEQLVLGQDPGTGLRAIIAIHDTTLGPALGGVRFWPYPDEDAAIVDALRLARGMTYKAAVAGLDLGGGKAVIIGDPRRDKNEYLLRAFGRLVESLNGRYLTAEDVGVTVADLDVVALETRHVTGTSAATSSGDPSVATAYGVWQGMKACAEAAWGGDSLRGRTVAVQGVGKVGHHLCRHLTEEGARLVVSDVYEPSAERAAREFGARVVAADAICDVECDIFSPCALGAVINEGTLPRLRCAVVAGAANNQLATEADGDAVAARGIVYAPDYVINAGGLINVADEVGRPYHRERAYAKIAGIRGNVSRVLETARREGIPTYRAADRLAEERIARIGGLKRKYVPR